MKQISRLLLCGLLAAWGLPATASGSWTDPPRAHSPAFMSAAPSEKKITATLVVDVVKFQPNGCGSIAYFQFPAVRDATSYEVTYKDNGATKVAIGPPFPQDGATYGVGAPVPAGQHRLGITGGTSSGSEDCAGAEAGYRARLQVVSAKATVGERTCNGKPVPKGKALVEGAVNHAPSIYHGVGDVRAGTILPDTGVRVNVSGPTDARPTTDATGYYCAIVSKGRYVLTPKKGAVRYTPPERALSVTGIKSGIDFSHAQYSVSGRFTIRRCPTTRGKCSVEGAAGGVTVRRDDTGDFANARPGKGAPGSYTVPPIDAGRVTVTPGGAPVGDSFAPSEIRLDLERNITGVDFRLLSPTKSNSDMPVAQIVELKGRGLAYVQRHGVGPLQPLGLGDTVGPGDRLSTDDDTLMAFEYIIGGRVGLNPNAGLVVMGERNTSRTGAVSGFGMWEKAQRLTQPLEIQTKGGVMGIKG